MAKMNVSIMKGQMMQSVRKSNDGDEVYSTRMEIETHDEKKDVYKSSYSGDIEQKIGYNNSDMSMELMVSDDKTVTMLSQWLKEAKAP